MMFPAFWKLRKSDPDRERPFKVGGGNVMINLITWVPEVLLIITVLLTILPLSSDPAEISTKVPVLVGTILTLIIGEILVRYSEKKHEQTTTHIEHIKNSEVH